MKLFTKPIAAGLLAVFGMSAQPAMAETLTEAPKCSTAKLIVPWKPGGGTHVVFSVFEEAIQRLDVPVKLQIVTIPGQSGNKGAKEAAKAKADGCTLLAIHQSALTSYLNGRIDLNWDDFETVSMLTSTPDMVGASGQVPWNSFAELKQAAIEAPGTIKTGTTFGSTSQFMWLQMEGLMGVEFKYIPFDGTRERITALLANTIELGTVNVATARKYMESGEIKAFAIAGENRSKHLPDVPTLKELGVDLVFALNRGVVAPKGTPETAINYWADVFKQAAADPAVVKALDAKGTDVSWVGPTEYAAWLDKTFTEFKALADKIGMNSN